jgi:uncharacterized protein with ParB-like and HNH nuclease domain
MPSFEVLLDGQQRLTVLYMLVKDEIPPYYEEEDDSKSGLQSQSSIGNYE